MCRLLIPLIVLIIILGAAFARSAHTSCSFGEGLLKSSGDYLEEQDELGDKNYYNKDRLFK